MNFNNIEYFITITEEKNISRAAEKMHISQQGLSEQLKKLEEEVGIALINRGRPITLTPAGEVMLRWGKEIIKSYNSMRDELNTISQRDRTTLTIAIPSTGMPSFLSALLELFSEQYPQVQVKILKIESREAEKQAERFDLFFSTLPLNDELENVYIVEDEYVVAVPQELAQKVYGEKWPSIESRLISERKLEAIRDLPFISTHNSLDEPILDQWKIFQEASFRPDIAFQSQNYELNLNVCISGKGAFITTKIYYEEFLKNKSFDNAVNIYKLDTPIDPVVVALSYRKGVKPKKAMGDFICMAKQYFSE